MEPAGRPRVTQDHSPQAPADIELHPMPKTERLVGARDGQEVDAFFLDVIHSLAAPGMSISDRRHQQPIENFAWNTEFWFTRSDCGPRAFVKIACNLQRLCRCKFAVHATNQSCIISAPS